MKQFLAEITVTAVGNTGVVNLMPCVLQSGDKAVGMVDNRDTRIGDAVEDVIVKL